MAAANFVPHLAEDRKAACWYVRARTRGGEYVVLSEPQPVKHLATRDLRRIRRQMFEGFMVEAAIALSRPTSPTSPEAV
jgi:hypothetical protein